jgi:hypothetical protein
MANKGGGYNGGLLLMIVFCYRISHDNVTAKRRLYRVVDKVALTADAR